MIWILRLRGPADEAEILVARLWELGTTGIIEDAVPGDTFQLRAFFDKRFADPEFAAFDPYWEPAEEKNWVRIIMDGWEPVSVGERFFIVPDWRDDPTPEGRIRLEVHPGIALGTGYHPTTQMCLEKMERLLRPGDTVVDLGCGSGILSHAARLLGAGRIVACDIDHQATCAAAENLKRAGVDVALFTGSTRSIPDGVANLAIANISADTLVVLKEEIQRLLAPGGRLILSGFDPGRAAEVQEAYGLAGPVASRESWAAVE